MTFACLLAVFATLAGPAAAQAEDAPHPSPDNKTLYVHHKDDTDEEVGWMSTLEEDPDSDDPQMCSGPDTYTISLQPPLTSSLILDPEEPVVATLFIGHAQSVGDVDVQPELKAGEEVIATAEDDGTLYAADYSELEFEMEVAVPEIPAGANLTLTVTISGTAVTNVCLGSGEDRQSTLELPIIALGGANATGEVQMFDLEGEQASILLEFENETTATYQYNWTTEMTSGELSYFVDVFNGSVAFDVMDGMGDSVASGEVNETGSDTMELNATEPGNWTIMLNFTAFSGSLDLTVGASTGGGNGTTTTTTTDGNTTGNGTSPEGEGGGIPAPSLVLIVGGVLAAAVVARRLRRDRL